MRPAAPERTEFRAMWGELGAGVVGLDGMGVTRAGVPGAINHSRESAVAQITGRERERPWTHPSGSD